MLEPLIFLDRVGYSYLFPAIVSLTLAPYLYNVFFQNSNFQDLSYYDWTTASGYTVKQFFALLFGTLLFPFGIMCLLIFALQSFKYSDKYHHVNTFVYTVLAVAFFTSCGISYNYMDAKDIIACGIFCFNASAKTYAKNNAGIVAIGTLYFIISFAFGLLFLYLLGLVLFHPLNPNNSSGPLQLAQKVAEDDLNVDEEGVPLLDGTYPETSVTGEQLNSSVTTSKPLARKIDTFKWIYIALAFGAFYPLLFFASISLPTWWNHFNRKYIDKYEAQVPDASLGYYMKLSLSDSVILKIYPDILMYYGSIYIISITALLAQAFPEISNFFSYRPKRLRIDVSVGQILLTIVLEVLVLGQFFYFYYDHGWDERVKSKFTSAERAARSLGQVCNLLTGLVVLPISRNSLWTNVFGVAWEAMLPYHQYMGTALLLSIAAHMFAWWIVFAENGSFPHDIFWIPLTYYSDDFTVPLAILTTWAIFLFLGIGAMESVRRWNYDLFVYLHHFNMVMFLMMLWHAPMCWYYIVPGLFLWTVDHTIRLIRPVTHYVALQDISTYIDKKDATQSTFVKLSYLVSKPSVLSNKSEWNPFVRDGYAPLLHSPGQYIFINIPAISTLAWHPFTISSSPGDSVTTHHIKVNFSKSKEDARQNRATQAASVKENGAEWTERLYQLASAFEGSYRDRQQSDKRAELSRLVVNIDGPYGVPIATHQYRSILMIGGGIGITPLLSTYKHALLSQFEGNSTTRWAFAHIKQVRLIWIVRTFANAAMFESQLRDLHTLLDDKASIESGNGRSAPRVGPTFQYTIYVTNQIEPSESSPRRQLSSSSIDISQTSFSSPANATLNLAYDNVTIFKGRPDLYREIVTLDPYGNEGLVYVCGPDSLTESCSEITKKKGISFLSHLFKF